MNKLWFTQTTEYHRRNDRKRATTQMNMKTLREAKRTRPHTSAQRVTTLAQVPKQVKLIYRERTRTPVALGGQWRQDSGIKGNISNDGDVLWVDKDAAYIYANHQTVHLTPVQFRTCKSANYTSLTEANVQTTSACTRVSERSSLCALSVSWHFLPPSSVAHSPASVFITLTDSWHVSLSIYCQHCLFECKLLEGKELFFF